MISFFLHMYHVVTSVIDCTSNSQMIICYTFEHCTTCNWRKKSHFWDCNKYKQKTRTLTMLPRAIAFRFQDLHSFSITAHAGFYILDSDDFIRSKWKKIVSVLFWRPSPDMKQCVGSRLTVVALNKQFLINVYRKYVNNKKLKLGTINLVSWRWRKWKSRQKR